MAGFFSNLFKKQDKVDFVHLLENGAILLDVRSKEEYAGGHAANSINIPLDRLSERLHKLNKEDVIIAICQSGMRSSNACRILKSAGFGQVYNGGCWQRF